jgi:four helix bundle suffix protein
MGLSEELIPLHGGYRRLKSFLCFLLDRQLAAQAQTFVEEGGFTEPLYRVRTARKK